MQVINNNFNKNSDQKIFRDKPTHFIDKALIKISPVNNDDPFQSAHNENMRLDAISFEKKLKLMKFESDLKQRLRAYKKITHQINEDSKIKVQDTNELNTFNRNKKIVKIDLIETKLKGVKIDEKSENITSSRTSVVSSHSPNHLLVEPNRFLIRSFKSEKQNLENVKNETKKRIATTRKNYGNLERKKAMEIKQQMDERKTEINLTQHKKKCEPFENIYHDDNDQTEPEIFQHKPSGNYTPQYSKTPTNYLKKKKAPTLKKPTNKNSDKNSYPYDEANAKSMANIDKYIPYLKQLLKERSQLLKIDVPSVCQCNNMTTFLWETDWNSCANNCVFYNNPKKYARVLINLVNKNSVGGQDRISLN